MSKRSGRNGTRKGERSVRRWKRGEKKTREREKGRVGSAGKEVEGDEVRWKRDEKWKGEQRER